MNLRGSWAERNGDNHAAKFIMRKVSRILGECD